MTSPYPETGQRNIDAAFSSAEALFAQRRFDEASEVYGNVLNALETQYGPDHPELAYPLQRLGDCYHALNRYRESLPLYIRLLSIGESILGKTHPDMLNLMVKVAKTQELIGSFQDSRKTFETLLPILEGAVGSNHQMYKSAQIEYQNLMDRINENKRAADAWRESSKTPPDGIPAPAQNMNPPQEEQMHVPDKPADDASWSTAEAPPQPGIVPFPQPGLPPQPGTKPQPGGPPQTGDEVFGQGKSLPPVADMPPLPGRPPENGPQVPASQPPKETYPPNFSNLSPEQGPDWSQSTRPGMDSLDFPGGAPRVPPTDFPGSSPQSPPSGFPGNSQQSPPSGFPGSSQQGPPSGFPGSSQQGPPSGFPGSSQQGPPSGFPGSSPQPPSRMPPGQLPPTNSVGPVESIPSDDAVKFGELGYESRKNDPTNDPYVDHLAHRVSELSPHQEEDQNLKSGAWHGSDVLKNLDLEKIKSGRYDDDDYDDEETDEEREERQFEKSQKLRAARSAVTKSSGIVSVVRGFKEYFIPFLALVVAFGAGYYFLTHTKEVKRELVSTKLEHVGAVQEAKHVFMTPDMRMKVALDDSSSCTFFQDARGVKVPYTVFNGKPNMIALQTFDSLLERQFWFHQVSDGLMTEHGQMLYLTTSPDWKVILEMQRLKQTINNWFKVTGSYPSDLQKIPKGAFAYVNPFTGVTEDMHISIIRYAQAEGRELRTQLVSGFRVTGDGSIGKGKILGYIQMDTSDRKNVKAVAFYMRGINHQGDFFETREFGQKLVCGFKGGVDDGNDQFSEEERKLYTPEKPTKVWISEVASVPVLLIHHSLPIFLGSIGFFLIMRSMMLAPGQSAENSTNRGFRLVGIVFVLATCMVVAIQFLLWN